MYNRSIRRIIYTVFTYFSIVYADTVFKIPYFPRQETHNQRLRKLSFNPHAPLAHKTFSQADIIVSPSLQIFDAYLLEDTDFSLSTPRKIHVDKECPKNGQFISNYGVHEVVKAGQHFVHSDRPWVHFCAQRLR